MHQLQKDVDYQKSTDLPDAVTQQLQRLAGAVGES
jgi:hypothetical protein